MTTLNPQPSALVPQFVVAGNVARDIVPGGWRLGGTVTFAAHQAHRLGYSVGVLTKAANDIDVAAQLPFADVRQVASATTTTFENLYEHGARTQSVHARGEPIDASDVPDEWRDAPIVLIGPVLGEVAHDFAAAFAGATLCGVSVQGWLRDVDAERRVVRTRWDGPPFWHGADVLFLSDEDIAGAPDQLDAWLRDVPIVAMTESWRGARVYAEGAWRRMDAFPEDEVDPTGAGDTFATAFLIRLHETGDVAQAARFGAAAASLSVGGIAAATIPAREEIEARLAQHPEVALR